MIYERFYFCHITSTDTKETEVNSGMSVSFKAKRKTKSFKFTVSYVTWF